MASGGLLIIFALTTEAQVGQDFTVKNVARNLLLNMCPLKGQ